MDLGRYTEDAVCFAMGVGRFELEGDGVRLLCRPSFHPEVCVTIRPGEIAMVGLQSMLSLEPVVGCMPEIAERSAIGAEEFGRVDELFERALEESRRPPKWVVIADGMKVSVARRAGDRIDRFAGHAMNEAEKELVEAVMLMARGQGARAGAAESGFPGVGITFLARGAGSFRSSLSRSCRKQR